MSTDPNCIFCKSQVFGTSRESDYTYICPECNTTLRGLLGSKRRPFGLTVRSGEYGGWWSHNSPDMHEFLKELICPQCGRPHPNIEREAIIQ